MSELDYSAPAEPFAAYGPRRLTACCWLSLLTVPVPPAPRAPSPAISPKTALTIGSSISGYDKERSGHPLGQVARWTMRPRRKKAELHAQALRRFANDF